MLFFSKNDGNIIILSIFKYQPVIMHDTPAPINIVTIGPQVGSSLKIFTNEIRIADIAAANARYIGAFSFYLIVKIAQKIKYANKYNSASFNP